MPSFAADPARLAFTGGETSFSPKRFSATRARLSFTGGQAIFAVGGATALSVTVPKLNRLHAREQMTNPDGTPTQRQMAMTQETAERIEEAFRALTTQVNDNTQLLNQVLAAQNLARAANDNVVAVDRRTSLAQSYTDPVDILTAASDGTVTIAAHERVYFDAARTRISVDGGTVTGQSGYVTIYYVDAARLGGAVAYVGTSNPIAQEGNTHIAGSVEIPASGTNTGGGVTAPGYTTPPPTSAGGIVTGGGSYDRP